MYTNNLHDDVFLHNSMLTMYMDIYIYPLCFLYADDHHHDDNHDNHDNNDYDCSRKILDE